MRDAVRSASGSWGEATSVSGGRAGAPGALTGSAEQASGARSAAAGPSSATWPLKGFLSKSWPSPGRAGLCVFQRGAGGEEAAPSAPRSRPRAGAFADTGFPARPDGSHTAAGAGRHGAPSLRRAGNWDQVRGGDSPTVTSEDGAGPCVWLRCHVWVLHVAALLDSRVSGRGGPGNARSEAAPGSWFCGRGQSPGLGFPSEMGDGHTSAVRVGGVSARLAGPGQGL